MRAGEKNENLVGSVPDLEQRQVFTKADRNLTDLAARFGLKTLPILKGGASKKDRSHD